MSVPRGRFSLSPNVTLLLAGLLVAGCDATQNGTAPATPPLATASPPPLAVIPAPKEANLPEGTVIITSEASKNATPEQRKAVVDRLLAPASAPTASTGLSPEAACQAVKQEVKRRYPTSDPKFIDHCVDTQHKEVVILSRRSDGTFDSAYYTRQVNLRLDDIIARYPPKPAQ